MLDELIPRLIVAPLDSAKKMLREYVAQERAPDQVEIAGLRVRVANLEAELEELEK